MGRHNLARRYELAGVLHNAYPAADLCSYLAGIFSFDLVLLLQMALDLIRPYCVLALLAHSYLELCHMGKISTGYACFCHADTLGG